MGSDSNFLSLSNVVTHQQENSLTPFLHHFFNPISASYFFSAYSGLAFEIFTTFAQRSISCASILRK